MIDNHPSNDGARALADLLPQLAVLEEDAIARPHTDPHAAAATALLVADWLTQREHEGSLAKVGLDAGAPRELARTARAIVALVEVLGGDYLCARKAIPKEIEERGQAVRASTMKELEQALPESRDVKMWLEAVRRGEGAVDLVYDLRTLATLLTRHAAEMPASLERLPAILSAASDAIEHALRADEPPELMLARGRLARLWTLFVPAYERAAKAARALSRERGAERDFPPLAIVAAHRRAQRRAQRTSMHDGDPTKSTGRNPRETGSRRAQRAVLELEVGIESDSNFYVGITENVSCDGIFVATYLPRPLGSKVDVALAMPDGKTLRECAVELEVL